MHKLRLLAGLLLAIWLINSSSALAQPAAKAWAWYNQQPWPCGFNYIPSNAVNYTAMWDKTSFSPALIDQELALAATTGFNCVRVVMQYAVWADDPAYFRQTFGRFLTIADKHRIRVMPCFFDDCIFNDQTDPKIGVQPEPVPGWYAWAWSPSPGHTLVADTTSYPKLERYVKDVLTTFRQDKRVLLWDLYNEPTNGGLGDKSLPLVRQVFAWARAVDPVQPVSVGYWSDNARLHALISRNADVTTFHSYGPAAVLQATAAQLRQERRPLLCTEWLNRPAGSVVATVLPVLFEQKIGALNWGFVNGKTQTHLPWGHRPGDPAPLVWQHDLYHPDLTPYQPTELAEFKKLIAASKTAAYRQAHTGRAADQGK